jgi:hypothetical protein
LTDEPSIHYLKFVITYEILRVSIGECIRSMLIFAPFSEEKISAKFPFGH